MRACVCARVDYRRCWIRCCSLMRDLVVFAAAVVAVAVAVAVVVVVAVIAVYPWICAHTEIQIYTYIDCTKEGCTDGESLLHAQLLFVWFDRPLRVLHTAMLFFVVFGFSIQANVNTRHVGLLYSIRKKSN